MLLKDTINTVDHVFNNGKIKVNIGKNYNISCYKIITHDFRKNTFDLRLRLSNRSMK